MIYKKMTKQVSEMFKGLPLTMRDRFMLLRLEQGLLDNREGLIPWISLIPVVQYISFKQLSPDLLEGELEAFKQLEDLVYNIIEIE